MILEQIPQIQTLTSREKYVLMGELWDDLAEQPLDPAMNQELVAELGRRAEDYRQHPERVVSWSEARQRILNSRAAK